MIGVYDAIMNIVNVSRHIITIKISYMQIKQKQKKKRKEMGSYCTQYK